MSGVVTGDAKFCKWQFENEK